MGLETLPLHRTTSTSPEGTTPSTSPTEGKGLPIEEHKDWPARGGTDFSALGNITWGYGGSFFGFLDGVGVVMMMMMMMMMISLWMEFVAYFLLYKPSLIVILVIFR